MAKFVPFIIKTDGSQNISVKIVRMKKSDAVQTEKEPVWQTSWLSDYIQDDAFEKYALKTSSGELVALAAYEILENDVMVHITYIESQPESNPTIVGHSKKYQGIGRVLIAYGIKLSIDHECGGTVTFEAKVPELAELSFFYMNLVTVSRLQRNPTVKSEIQMRNFEASIPVGFFTYPISQAADITAFKATTVPVGEDQMPMIEQTQEIVHKFNTVYGEALVQPKIMLPENDSCRRLPGIDGKAKMSKSLGNCIYLSEEPDEIKKKVMSMYTDPDHIKITDPGKIEGNTVFTYLDAFCQPEHFERYLPDYANLDELKAHYQRGGLGDVKVKKFLNNVLQETLEPIRNRRKELEKDIPAIYEMLKKGSEEAEKVAAQTLADVKAAMKINYFDDLDLIRSQAERYGK